MSDSSNKKAIRNEKDNKFIQNNKDLNESVYLEQKFHLFSND